ncbi:lipopolysaccharide biosynthesis protein [Pedobacter sp. L105]|uniref:lipopolysaccharide biosynthesis protein n=1 Tax=Pedobacter sp. L105 TaxID=1641871 RepID=UPI00131EB491|nr:lipopolysaccharide biosynthesis protein [Pedobacter sp. L105]
MSLIKTVLSTFKNIHFQSLLGNGVMATFGMVTMAILYRAMSVNDIGVYVFFMTIWGLIDTLRSGFLTNAFIKFYSGTEQNRAEVVAGSAWVLSLCITAVLILINIPTYLLSSHLQNEGMILFLKYFSLISISTLPSFMANIIVQGDKRFDRLLWLRLINQVLFTGIVIAMTMMKISTLTNVILAYIFSNMVASLAVMFMGWTMIGSIVKWSREAFLELFHFGKYSVGTNVGSNLFKVTDTFFINFFLGPAALAVYNLGGRLIQIIEMLLLSFAASGLPSLSVYYNHGQKAEMMHVMKKLVGMLSIVIFGIAILSIIFAEPLIHLIGGERYVHTEAPNLFRIFMSMAVLYPTDRFFALTLEVIHKPKINFYKILIMLLANLAGDYIGVTIFKSIYSIVIANIFPLLMAIVITYIPLNKYSKFKFWEMYIIGYKEVIIFIKQIYSTLFIKSKVENN